MKKRWFSILILCLSVSAAPLVIAQSSKPAKLSTADQKKAKKLFDDAKAAEKKGDLGRALFSYQEAYKITQAPAVLVYIGEVQQQMGAYAAAAETYNAFLATNPSDPKQKEYIQQRLAEVTKMLPASTQPTVEPVKPVIEPEPTSVPIKEPTTTPILDPDPRTKASDPLTKDSTTQPKEVVPPKEVVAPTTTESGPLSVDKENEGVPAIAFGVGAGAFGVGGISALLLSVDASNDADDKRNINFGEDPPAQAELDELFTRARNREVASYALFGAAAVSVTLYFVKKSKQDRSTQTAQAK